MKKIALIIALLICGCSDKHIACNIQTKNKQQNYQMESQYTIYYRGGYVTKVKEKEQYFSNDSSVLGYYQNYLKMQSLNFKTLYGGMYYQISVNKNVVIYESQIDFNQVNIEALKQNHYVDPSYIKKDRVSLTGIKNNYEQKGAVCK